MVFGTATPTPHAALGTPHLTTLFTHDDTGRQTAVTDPEGNTTHTAYTLRDPTHTFNPDVSPAGILTSDLSTLTSQMDTTTWVYEDATGLLLEKLYADNKGPTYTYTPNSPLISGYTLGGLTRTVTYENNRNLIDTVANTWDTTLISQFDYTNDKAGRRTAREDSGTAFASTQNNTFSYNSRNEVTSADMRNGTSTYSFDQIGNRRTAAVPAATFLPGGTFDYTTNALNQYTSIGASAPPPPISPVHDDDGNLTHDGEKWHFRWNAENRMVEIRDYEENPVDGSTRIHNTYDGQGRRVRKAVEEYSLTSDLWTLTSDLRFFYDGWNLIYEIDVLAADPEPTFYVWGLDLSQSLQGAGGVGGLLLVLTSNSQLPATAHAVSYDANGNISEYINLANGNVDAHLEYDAFGRIIASTGTAPSNFGFSTKYEDVETGYLYYGFRYYDPQTGRWPNRDPIGERGGVNLYSSMFNNLLSFIDPLGLDPCCPGGSPLDCSRLADRIAILEQAVQRRRDAIANNPASSHESNRERLAQLAEQANLLTGTGTALVTMGQGLYAGSTGAPFVSNYGIPITSTGSRTAPLTQTAGSMVWGLGAVTSVVGAGVDAHRAGRAFGSGDTLSGTGYTASAIGATVGIFYWPAAVGTGLGNLTVMGIDRYYDGQNSQRDMESLD